MEQISKFFKFNVPVDISIILSHKTWPSNNKSHCFMDMLYKRKPHTKNLNPLPSVVEILMLLINQNWNNKICIEYVFNHMCSFRGLKKLGLWSGGKWPPGHWAFKAALDSISWLQPCRSTSSKGDISKT